MIKSFKDTGLELFATTGSTRKLSVQNHSRVAPLLARLDASIQPEDMNLPGFHFHELQGDQAGRYSVRVTGNWRMTFAFDGADAIDVDLEDYH